MSTHAVIADILARALTVPGLVSSDEIYLHARDSGRSPRHGEVCVGMTRTDAADDRQRRGPSHERGEVSVLLAWQLSGVRLADAVTNPAGEAAWLAAEAAIRSAILTPRSTVYELGWSGTARTAGSKEWVYSELSFNVLYWFQP